MFFSHFQHFSSSLKQFIYDAFFKKMLQFTSIGVNDKHTDTHILIIIQMHILTNTYIHTDRHTPIVGDAAANIFKLSHVFFFRKGKQYSYFRSCLMKENFNTLHDFTYLPLSWKLSLYWFCSGLCPTLFSREPEELRATQPSSSKNCTTFRHSFSVVYFCPPPV